jgi:hypothetical protein
VTYTFYDINCAVTDYNEQKKMHCAFMNIIKLLIADKSRLEGQLCKTALSVD